MNCQGMEPSHLAHGRQAARALGPASACLLEQLLRELVQWTARAEAGGGNELAADLRRTGWLLALLQPPSSAVPRLEREGLRWIMELAQTAAEQQKPARRIDLVGFDRVALTSRADPSLALELAVSALDLTLVHGARVEVTLARDSDGWNVLLDGGASQVRLGWPANWLELAPTSDTLRSPHGPGSRSD